MLLRSGRIYHPNYLDMEAKLDLILKELQDLKLKVEGLESKHKEETSRDDLRDDRQEENTNRRKGDKGDIIHRIKIDLPTFDGIHDPKIFSLTADLDYYFNW